jgi:hypothetical protein
MVAIAAGLTLSLVGGAVFAACPAGAPEGLFKGAIGPDGPDLNEVTLNVFCAEGVYRGTFYTSRGDYRAADAGSTAGHVRLSIDAGGGPGTADLAVTGDTLAGGFSLAGSSAALTLARAGPPLPATGMRATLALTSAQWHEDLQAFAEQLPKRHANAFATLPKAAFDADVAALDKGLDRMSGDEVFVNLLRIANQIGDGHTGMGLPLDRAQLPLQLGRFGDEVRVVAAGPGLERALGARVTAIGPTPIEEAWKRALTLTPRDELPSLREGRAADYLSRGLLLHGLKIAADREQVVFALVDDRGRRFKLPVTSLPPMATPPQLTPAAGKRGLADQDPGKPFWCQAPQAGAVYCQFRSYQELRTRAAEMFALVDQTQATKLILDLRDNGGGDNTEGYRWLILPILQRPDLNQKGRLYVLIGSETFSAAMNNAAQFQDLTAATLVGQQIGEKPNSYQEPRQFRLPNSHLVVRASTRFYRFKQHGPNAVTPDKTIAPTWADVKAGRDPVLDWVLAQPTA